VTTYPYVCVGKYLHMEKRRDVFQAIADPTRREIIHLVTRKPLTLNSIAERFDLARATISEHVKILQECGLLFIEQKGRERYCEARLTKLSEVADWVKQYEQHWNSTLDSLEAFLDKKHNAKTKRNKLK
jgi:DNA-binding transcriptional ArsR family regulator